MGALILKTKTMGFLGGLLGATIKTALTPLAVVNDVVNVMEGEDVSTTAEHIGDIVGDVKDSLSDLKDGDLI